MHGGAWLKKIVLPSSEDGYYRFGELPALIAEALHPDEKRPDDFILSVVIWRDDGSEYGQFIECTPPADSRENNLDRHAEWTQTPIELTEEDKAHPDRCKWLHWLWHEQRRPDAARRYWPDGRALIVWSEETQNRSKRAVSLASEREWYEHRMTRDASLASDTPGHLCVLDGNLNELTFKHGAALERGWVHIDELNRWGATLRPPSVFSTPTAQRPTYSYPMFERLQPRTEWRGGRMVDTDVLTLTEAAKLASKHAGDEVTQEDFLRAAGRGEIALRAVVHRTAKVHRYDGGVYCNGGTVNENIVPAGSIPTLPLTACQHLAATGRASWRTFDGFEQIDGVLMRYTSGILSNDEPDFVTVPEDCRVTGNDVHSLADEFVSSSSERGHVAAKAETDSGKEPAWSVTKPRRYHGYTFPLHRLLVSAHREGRPCPTARDVLETWRVDKPLEIARVLSDGLDYIDARGNEKPADLKAVQKAIKRMTTGTR